MTREVQSVHDMGKVQKEDVSILSTGIIPVSSHSDGWCPRRKIPGKPAKRNQ